MAKDKEQKKDLKMSDFDFLQSGKRLHKLELRFNANTSQKVYVKADFRIDNKRDDTQVGVYLSGQEFKEVMEKLQDWHENYFKHISIFGKLTGREKDDEKADTGSAMPF